MANRLAEQTSPYLLQHKDNPVDWYPWGEAALALSKQADKPILLSIGYSACHWCHVMERESFEDEQTAAYMNQHFVCVKVDREERPDVDGIYMNAVQAMTGHGGWPLTVFCDPDGVPFYGGTYFPPESRYGMPSFRQVLEGVVTAWQARRAEIQAAAPQTVRGLEAASRIQASSETMSPSVLEHAVRGLAQQFDQSNGGFGGAPKFPPASTLEFLMRVASDQPVGPVAEQARQMTTRTLERMARGGVYDQVGGGFARYSVDAHWMIPHFEKMLYDNALLARAYLHGWQLTGADEFLRVCTETLDWAIREMRAPDGGFYSALDADSEGEEGKFYLWTSDQVRKELGDRADPVIRYWGLDAEPNFEGRANVLHVAGGEIEPELLQLARERLYELRSKRVWPGRDDKQLASWNALMIAALADAGAVLERSDYVDAARTCARFVLTVMRDRSGRLLRTSKDGRASLNAYLEDHAFLVEALLALYESTFETSWFTEARSLAEVMIERYADPDGGFFTTSSDHEQLVTRPKDIQDHPIPSGNSSAIFALLRLAAFTDEPDYERRALDGLRLLHEPAARHPQAFGHLLQALHFRFAPRREVALVGDDLQPLARTVRSSFRPALVLAGMRPGDAEAQKRIPLLAGREPVDGQPAAYVCERFACRLPVTAPHELERELAA
jgi:uncharacterized protein YyaL (SSP411 family)